MITKKMSRSSPNIIQLARAYLGMSRALVAIFVVAHAGLASIFALGRLPDLRTIVIGILACFFGTASLISLNDLLDVELDKKRLKQDSKEFDIGSLFIQHPVAKGIISFQAGVVWVVITGLASMYFMALLNYQLWFLFLAIAVCVYLYCRLSQLTYWKFLAVATAVTLGAVAGWLAVAWPQKATFTFALFIIWTFLWEIGGRNLPNDFNDLEEDRQLKIKTIPVVFGPQRAAQIIFFVLILTYLVSIPLLLTAKLPLIFALATFLLGVYLLILPAYRLLKNPTSQMSVKLYNRSALYPVSMLLILMLTIYLFSGKLNLS